jgi:type IV pilus assembly protein PilC
LIGASNILQHDWWLLVGIGGVLFAGLRLYLRTPSGRRQFDILKFRLPVFGGIFSKIYLVRFSRSFSTLIASGIPVTKALEIVADVIGNIIYKELTLQTIDEVEAGNSIASVLARSKMVPPMLPQMMIVGEQTGKLDLILDKLSAFYAKELENLVNNLVSIIEPLILVVMGGAVAIIVMAILLPMYNLANTIN